MLTIACLYIHRPMHIRKCSMINYLYIRQVVGVCPGQILHCHLLLFIGTPCSVSLFHDASLTAVPHQKFIVLFGDFTTAAAVNDQFQVLTVP